MRIGIDAANLRGGGGLTHLVEILRAADPPRFGIEEIVVWGSQATLAQIEERPWLTRAHCPLLDRPLPHRRFWQRFQLASHAHQHRCDLLFAPGGDYTGGFRPFVTMSRNMLPFEAKEARRYGFSPDYFKQLLRRWSQSSTFRRANAVIFLTDYARESVSRLVDLEKTRVAMIPHGVTDRFSAAPRKQESIEAYTPQDPFRVLYVSHVNLYKHQWHLAAAIAELRAEGYPLKLELVGPAQPAALKRLRAALQQLDPHRQWVDYHGAVSHGELPAFYHRADLFAFASSCENMPNVLLEAMSAGLPIASSRCGPMPEVLKDGGLYFDPEDVQSTATAIRALLVSPELRSEKAALARKYSMAYSWKKCAESTFQLLVEAATGRSEVSADPTIKDRRSQPVHG